MFQFAFAAELFRFKQAAPQDEPPLQLPPNNAIVVAESLNHKPSVMYVELLPPISTGNLPNRPDFVVF